MNKLIIKGRYSSFSTLQRSNIPIEEKRNIREDASWSYKGVPQSPWLLGGYYPHAAGRTYE